MGGLLRVEPEPEEPAHAALVLARLHGALGRQSARRQPSSDQRCALRRERDGSFVFFGSSLFRCRSQLETGRRLIPV